MPKMRAFKAVKRYCRICEKKLPPNKYFFCNYHKATHNSDKYAYSEPDNNLLYGDSNYFDDREYPKDVKISKANLKAKLIESLIEKYA